MNCDKIAPTTEELLRMTDIELEAWDEAAWRITRAIDTIQKMKKLVEEAKQ
jgi:hypothetical protein